MEETDSKITVSSINDINSFNMERIITIRGDPEKICKAEAEISVKLRQAFESDLNSLPVSTSFVFSQKVVGLLISRPFFQKLFIIFTFFFQAQNVMFPNLHPAAMVTPMGMGLAAFNPNAVPMQPHLRVPGPGSFLSGGGGGYYPAAFNGVQVPGGSPGGAKTNSATRNVTIDFKICIFRNYVKLQYELILQYHHEIFYYFYVKSLYLSFFQKCPQFQTINTEEAIITIHTMATILIIMVIQRLTWLQVRVGRTIWAVEARMAIRPAVRLAQVKPLTCIFPTVRWGL